MSDQIDQQPTRYGGSQNNLSLIIGALGVTFAIATQFKPEISEFRKSVVETVRQAVSSQPKTTTQQTLVAK